MKYEIRTEQVEDHPTLYLVAEVDKTEPIGIFVDPSYAQSFRDHLNETQD